MAGNITGASHVPAPVNVKLIRRLLRVASFHMVYHNGALPSSLQENQGTFTVKWRRVNKIPTSVTPLGEPTGASAWQLGRTSVTPTISDLTEAVQKFGQFIQHSEDLDLMQVNSDSRALMRVLGIAAGESMDLLQRDKLNAEATARWASGVASDAVTVAEIKAGDVDFAFTELRTAGAMRQFPMGTGSQNIGTIPVRQSYFGACHTHVEPDVRNIAGFIDVERYASFIRPLPGEFGAVRGVRWASTPFAPVSSGAGTTSVAGMRGAAPNANDIYSTFVWGLESHGSVNLGSEHISEIYESHEMPPTIELIRKAVGSAGAGDPLNELGTIAYKFRHAGKVLNSAWVKKIRTLSKVQ